LNPGETVTASCLSLEARVRRELRAHLHALGFAAGPGGTLVPPNQSKDVLRGLHRVQRETLLARQASFVARAWPGLKGYFANGAELDVSRITPRLELIEGATWQSDLFRLASLTWSIPLSQGYGRRMRFLVWDDAHEKLIGLFALGDPVFNLRVRDAWVGWGVDDRKQRLVNVLDAYVLGAVPPYSFLLGGKLVASLVCTREVKNLFARRYHDSRGVISGQRKAPSLAVVTTASAFGRSSLYNRLRIGKRVLFRPLGFTEGWGHFHIPDDLFALIREYLAARHHRYASDYRYGHGPNWKMRAVRQALTLMGIAPGTLKHGINREVFACEVASNARSFLAGASRTARYDGLQSVTEIGPLARDRWLVPRSTRDAEYRRWSSEDIMPLVMQTDAPAAHLERTGTYGARES
jgi:hypothetical protein